MRKFWLAMAVASLGCGMTACVTSGGGGGGAPTDTAGGGDDAKTGSDTSGGDNDTSSGGDTGGGGSDSTGGGSDTSSAGSEKTINEIQTDGNSATCADANKIVNTLNGVTVHHAVVTSGLILSTTSSGKKLEGLFVQDKGGGKNSGIYLTEDAPGPLANLKVGDLVTITGDVAEFYCYTEIKPLAVTPEGATDMATAVTVDVATIGEAAAPADNEAYESVFISLEGVVVSDPAMADSADSKGGLHTMAVGKTESDVTLRIGAGFGKIYPIAKDGKTPNYQKGQKLNIQGFLQYSFSKWQLTPSSITIVP